MLLASMGVASAQWLTQSITVKPGWSAVYLHLDASYITLDQLVGTDPQNPITDVWLWQTPTTPNQFVTSPQDPIVGGSSWVHWQRDAASGANALIRLAPNAAYLVHSSASTPFTWNVRGTPAAPQYSWTSSGLNFLGFPTAPGAPPAFDTFLSLSPPFQSTAEIYAYSGGDLGASNPSRLLAMHTTPVTRGQAFWMRSGTLFNNYFGPFQALFASASGVDFGDTLSRYTFRLRNLTSSNLPVTLSLIASEAAPVGQQSFPQVPALLLRGARLSNDLAYASLPLNPGTPTTWILPPQGTPGSEIEVTLGLNRTAITNAPGSVFGGILQLTDGFHMSEIDVPVKGQVGSYAGLWIGDVQLREVDTYLKIYNRDSKDRPIPATDGTHAYQLQQVVTTNGSVAQPFPLRLILHHSGTQSVILQRVYVGLDTHSNQVVSTLESSLDPARRDTARRISSIQFPWTPSNAPLPCQGLLAPGSQLTASTVLPYDDQISNPFLHTYHPDHDNLSSDFGKQLERGSESYDIQRDLHLQLQAPATDFFSLTEASQSMTGLYEETVTLKGRGTATRTFHSSGTVSLHRISNLSTLTRN